MTISPLLDLWYCECVSGLTAPSHFSKLLEYETRLEELLQRHPTFTVVVNTMRTFCRVNPCGKVYRASGHQLLVADALFDLGDEFRRVAFHQLPNTRSKLAPEIHPRVIANG